MTSHSMAYVTNSVVLYSKDFLELFKTSAMEIETFIKPTLGFQHVAHSIENLASPDKISIQPL